MFRHPAWAVGSYSSGPLAAGIVGTKSTGGFYRRDGSLCREVRSPIEVDAALAEVGLLMLIDLVLGRLRVHRAPRLGRHQPRAALWNLRMKLRVRIWQP